MMEVHNTAINLVAKQRRFACCWPAGDYYEALNILFRMENALRVPPSSGADDVGYGWDAEMQRREGAS